MLPFLILHVQVHAQGHQPKHILPPPNYLVNITCNELLNLL